MAQIRVKYGGCGIKYTDANGTERHALKTPESGAFECDDAQAERLVGLGVAEYVGLQWKEVNNSVQPEETGDDAKQQETGEPEKATGHLDAEQLAEMDYNELKKLAADMGVKPAGQKKTDYIAAIAAVEVEPGDEVDLDEDDELPDLSAADPE